MIYRWRFNLVYCAQFSERRRAREARKPASVAIIISCNDVDDIERIIYCNAMSSLSAELPSPRPARPIWTVNEERDVGREFKWPVVCWPAGRRSYECVGDEDAHGYTPTHSRRLMLYESDAGGVVPLCSLKVPVEDVFISFPRWSATFFFARVMSFSLSLRGTWAELTTARDLNALVIHAAVTGL